MELGNPFINDTYNYISSRWGWRIHPTTGAVSKHNDDANISDYAKDAVEIMQKVGNINGKSNNLFDPKGNATRAELTTVLMRYLEEVK